ncbi:protein FAM83G-like [Salarias fasciatus]|uniref:Protein FAM83G-like n=1 Tax=Salarias fasciatus TaxID=181472 RepID=A0A672GXX3_SALFA|nr:protein FAM83G-like [Salarias fasciatus]
MALSQIQCLDDHHVNWRVSESKPEFFYSEDQRLALEELIAKGREALAEYVCKHGIREFLSEPEVERIVRTAEAYRPGHEHHQKPETPTTPGTPGAPGAGEEAEDGEVSLEYWPDRSEASVAELDLGWPEAINYRGVTRVSVYTQPPLETQTHIKEVVRKSIASAQKVIAVVMDAFTDVDIFRDLLDAAYRRRIPVYIILDMAAVPSFLTMCGRADMHRGHLKNLRVRCCGGVEFYTRSAQKVRGSLSQKFLLVDGDRAISGSYSFTWSSSRLDRNLITVITGQAVETFDLQFRELYLMSRGVSLSKVPMVDEPIPDPLPQVAPAPVPASVARKLVNPKYALVATGTHISPTSSDQNSSNKNSQNPTGLKVMKRIKEVVEAPPIHPGLVGMEKAYLIPYLPTWPEPDPPSDVIGFINIRDEKRAHQVHLQRSERFEVSQAIRFSAPLLKPQTEESASSKNAKAEAKNPSGTTSPKAPSPVSPTSKPINQQMAVVDAPQQPSAPPAQEAHPSKPPTKVSAESLPAGQEKTQTDETEAAAPPVPKRRTLQLVIDPETSDHVSVVKMDQVESLEDSFDRRRAQKNAPLVHGRLTSRDDAGDSGSNGDDSQDSTKVICDRAVNDDPSSASTASDDEFYDCSPTDQISPLTNGLNSGSGQGHRQGDGGFNMMARFSQSMLDLREPSQREDSAALIRQSQQLRRQGYPSPHRHIGQLFQSSRSPARDGRPRGNKVVIAKPGSFHRPARAAAAIIGGHRYWQSQTMQPDAARRAETRPGRSPRRQSPGNKKMERPSQQPAVTSTGILGVSLSKLGSFRNLRSRGGASPKKATQNNKPAR